jgi:uncharacterized membrane protein YhaH (DUF805 family)
MYMSGFARGRMRRKPYWLSVVLATAVFMLLSPILPSAGGAAATLVFAMLAALRLHDAGRSGWLNLIWILGQVALVAGVLLSPWGEAMLRADAQGEWVRLGVYAAAALIQYGFLTWAGVLKSDPADNRYGRASVRKAE